LGEANSCESLTLEDVSGLKEPNLFRQGRSGLIFFRYEFGEHYIAQGLAIQEFAAFHVTAVSSFFTVQFWALYVSYEWARP
jgi:hypothetical protein